MVALVVASIARSFQSRACVFSHGRVNEVDKVVKSCCALFSKLWVGSCLRVVVERYLVSEFGFGHGGEGDFFLSDILHESIVLRIFFHLVVIL